MTPDKAVFEFDLEDELRYTDEFLDNQEPGLGLELLCSLTDDDPEELLVDEDTRIFVMYRYWDVDDDQPLYEVWNMKNDEEKVHAAEWVHEHLRLAEDGDGQ